MKDALKCYVSGRQLDAVTRQGIISFAVPEYGVLFRCGASGARSDLEVIAFLSFLRFVDLNKDEFKKRQMLIYSDFPVLVYLMNKGAVAGKGTDAVIRQAEKYTKGISYQVKWIDEKGNRAAGSINDIPRLPADSRLNLKSFANLTSAKVVADIGKSSIV